MSNYSSGSSGRRTGNTGSRRRSSEPARSSRSAHSRTSAVRSGSGRSASRTTAGHHTKRRKRQRMDITQILLIVIGVLVAILCISLVAKGCGKSGAGSQKAETESSAAESASAPLTVDGIDITGKTQAEARETILGQYGWSVKATYEEKEIAVTNLMEAKVDELLEEVYAGDLTAGGTFEVNTDNMIEAAKAEAALIAGNWSMVARNGGISGYDAESGKFTFTEGTNGLVIDQDKLAEDLVALIHNKDFGAVIRVQVKEVSPELTAAQLKEKYKTIATYTTKTTSNSNRNENIRLASKALNGVIVNPGQEFSFNSTTGARTEAKGYKPAAAYLNGEVVQEPGGGVCQVSSTLYNAVIFAGLKSTERHAHSYEPSYVTPGEDAAVSFGGPDFKFVNNSDYPIAIKTSFANQDLTVSIYGVPILKEGMKVRMASEKTSDIDPPAPVYEEDQTLQPDEQKEAKAAVPGTKWKTDLVVYENGNEVSREFFHNSAYRGKAAIIKRNTSGVVVTTADPSASAEETTAPESQAPGGSEPQGPGSGGPGSETPGSQPQETETPGGSKPAEPNGPAPGNEGGAPGPEGPAPGGENAPGSAPAEQPSNPVVDQGPAAPGFGQ